MKPSELTGAALDWAVLKAIYPGCDSGSFWLNFARANKHTEDWALSGPIIERERIRLVFRDLGAASYWCAEAYEAYQGNQYIDGKGPTPLIAAMRCYVSSKLGDEVQVPEELR